MTINDVVNKYPATMQVFNNHAFDTCCGGAQSIALAAASNGANIPVVLRELNEAITSK